MSVRPNRSRLLQSLNLTVIGAGTFVSDEVSVPVGLSSLVTQAIFVRGGGGTTCDVFLQTSLDNGATWMDIAQWALATTTVTKIHSVRPYTAVAANITPTDGTMTDNTILDGVLGDRLRVKSIVVGTYSSTSTLDVRIVQN